MEGDGVSEVLGEFRDEGWESEQEVGFKGGVAGS
jgi:hypothetical protein